MSAAVSCVNGSKLDAEDFFSDLAWWGRKYADRFQVPMGSLRLVKRSSGYTAAWVCRESDPSCFCTASTATEALESLRDMLRREVESEES